MQENEKIIRVIQEWVLDDWPDCDIITQSQLKWSITEENATELLNKAKQKWLNQPQLLAEDKKRIRIEGLKRLKRSLKAEYKGTPEGIRAILQIEQQIINLENGPLVKFKRTIKSGSF